MKITQFSIFDMWDLFVDITLLDITRFIVEF